MVLRGPPLDAPRRSAVLPAAERRGIGIWALVACVGVAVVARGRLGVLGVDEVRVWSTRFVSMALQALPFLALGVVLSGAIAVFLSGDRLRRLLPRRPLLAVPVAALAGVVLPGCECGSVPIAGRLIAKGTPPAAALTFLLSAPAINPVVLVATATAFPGQPGMVLGRVAASLLASMVIGALWTRRRLNNLCIVPDDRHSHRLSAFGRFCEAASTDLVHAGGYLVLGAAVAATIQVAVPTQVLDTLGGHAVLSLASMALLAVLLSVCSEADAFVAAGLPHFSLRARLVFLVVGPMVDLKLIAMQRGVLGAAVTWRFAPMVFGAAVLSAVLVGAVLL